jgi:hypothetical protein
VHVFTRRTLCVSALAMALAAVAQRPAFAIAAEEISADNVKDLIELKGSSHSKERKRSQYPVFASCLSRATKVTARSEDWLGGMGGGKSSGSKASMEVMLANVDHALMQSIANDAYPAFVTKMKAAGVEVVAAETLKASETFKSLELTEAVPEKAVHQEIAGRRHARGCRIAV